MGYSTSQIIHRIFHSKPSMNQLDFVHLESPCSVHPFKARPGISEAHDLCDRGANRCTQDVKLSSFSGHLMGVNVKDMFLSFSGCHNHHFHESHSSHIRYFRCHSIILFCHHLSSVVCRGPPLRSAKGFDPNVSRGKNLETLRGIRGSWGRHEMVQYIYRYV